MSKRIRKSFFLRGLVTLLPAILTIVLFGLVVQVADKYVTGPINRGLSWSLESNSAGWSVLRQLGIDPEATEFVDEQALIPGTTLYYLARNRDSNSASLDSYEKELLDLRATESGFFRDLDAIAIHRVRLRSAVTRILPPWIGILLSVLLVLTLGYLASGFLGRRLIASVDKALHAIPIIRSVYPYAKQLVEFFLSESAIEFDSVVAVPYPSEGLWSIGLVTGPGLKSLQADDDTQIISVFMPTSPMPMTGYTVFVDKSKVIPLKMSVDEALRVTVSGGVIVPPAEQVPAAKQQVSTPRLTDSESTPS